MALSSATILEVAEDLDSMSEDVGREIDALRERLLDEDFGLPPEAREKLVRALGENASEDEQADAIYPLVDEMRWKHHSAWEKYKKTVKKSNLWGAPENPEVEREYRLLSRWYGALDDLHEKLKKFHQLESNRDKLREFARHLKEDGF